MKRIFCCLIIVFVTTILFAETQYKVIEVVGNVSRFEGKNKVSVAKGDVVTESTVVMVTYKASMKVEDTVTHEKITINKVGKNKLQALIGKNNSVIASGKDYMDYVRKQINGNTSLQKIQSDPATVTRETDSLKTDTLICQ